MNTKPFTLLALIVATVPLRLAAESQPVFQKTLPDGRTVTVKKSVRMERNSVAPTNRPVLPTNFNVVTVSLNMEVARYTMHIGDEHAAEVVAWEKEQSLLPIPSANIDEALQVLDVAAKGDKIAILYSTRTVTVDIIQKRAGGFTLLATHPLFTISSFKGVRSGQLVWITDLYVVLESASETTQPELYRVTTNTSLRLFP